MTTQETQRSQQAQEVDHDAQGVPGPRAHTADPVPREVVGREHEMRLLRASVRAGRDIILEGPPGTSKTTMLRSITDSWSIPLFLVEGNADLTPAKLIGHHNPARVLREGYTLDNFVPGPLIQAMTSGGFLYLEEMNRSPEDALNTLLTAVGEREITIPRLSTFVARPSFRVVASMNPLDDIGTMRLSAGIHDRFCRLLVDYQDETFEREIVRLHASAGAGTPAELLTEMIDDAVAIVRATRSHPDIRQGSSVRGAIDTVLIARELAETDTSPRSQDYQNLMLDALVVALSGRIWVDEAAATTAEMILTRLWQEHLIRQSRAEPG